MLAALPVAVRALAPGGPVTLPFTIDELGLAVNVSVAPPAGSGLVPLTTFFREYSAVQWDHAPCATRDCSVYSTDSYVATGVEGSCVRPGSAAALAEPMVQVTLFYNGQLDNEGSASAPGDGQPWASIDVECLAYVNSGTDRWPLEVWHRADVEDYWTLANPESRANATEQGYTKFMSVGFVSSDVSPAPDALNVLRIEWA